MADTFYCNYCAHIIYGLSGDVVYLDVHDHATGDVTDIPLPPPYTVWMFQRAHAPDPSYYTFQIARDFFYFDTSSIPIDAVITNVQLRFYVYTYWQISGRAISIVVQNGQPTYPHSPAEDGDFLYSNYSGNGGEVSVGTGWKTITFNEDARSWINKGGETKLALRIDRDVNSDAPPTPPPGADLVTEGVRIYHKANYYARLIITYTTAGVTTEAVTQKGYQCAMGNGTATGENITERGFEIKLEYAGTLGNYVFHEVAGFVGNVTLSGTTWIGTLVKTEKETGSFEAGAYELVLGYPSVLGNPSSVFNDKLFACESYTYRAYAIIDGETYYGDWVAFTTDCYPVGHQDDDTPPIYIPPIIPPPEEPEEPIEDIIPPFEWPELPTVEMPDGYGSGMFYYRKAYKKKDLDDLRRKCRIFLDNSVEYALVLNHNMRVLQQFLNYMHIYVDTDEYNGFKDLIPTQHLNALAHEELDVSDFKAIINNFISNSVNNTMNVNSNFRLIRNGLSDYEYSDDVGFIEEKVSTRPVAVSDPDVEMLKKKVDALSREMSSNYATTQHNLYVVRSMIL